MSVVSVAELQRAWHAVQAGHFRAGTGEPVPERRLFEDPTGAVRAELCWTPSTPVLPVLGCHGACGATTLAVAVATVLDRPVRVIEAAPAGSSGLTGFATAELGDTGAGWVRGRRDQIILDRLGTGDGRPDQVPVPDPGSRELALQVLDTAGTGRLALSAGWVRSTVLGAERLVLVTTATVPGLRGLERVLDELGTCPRRVAVAVQGPRRRRWPREVTACAGPRTQALLEQAEVQVPHDPGLPVRGLDTSPLPRGVLSAATTITHLLQLPGSPTHHQKGNT